MIKRLRPHLVVAILFAPLSVLMLAMAVLSLHWRMQYDVPVLLYMARLIDAYKVVPYRQLFEIQMPGTFWLNILIGRLINYSDDLRLRIVDLGYLAVLLTTTGLWMRPFGWRVVWASIVLFGLYYLNTGFAIIMQREYLLLLPAVASIVFAASARRFAPWLRALVLGLGFGLCATVKPHFAIGLPIVLFTLLADLSPDHDTGKPLWQQRLIILTAAGAGFALPVIAVVIYLLQTGALAQFYEVVQNFGPIYSKFGYSISRKSYILVEPDQRAGFTLEQYALLLSERWLWITAAAITAVMWFSRGVGDPRNRQFRLILALAGAYLIYPIFTGQFWPYHWLPFYYFIILAISICCAEISFPATSTGKILRWLAPSVAMASILMPNNLIVSSAQKLWDYYVLGSRGVDPAVVRADEIATFLREHLQPGDRVQSLDGVGGGVLQGMLISDAQLATSFPLDTTLYFDVSSPYTQAAREQFVSELSIARPRYIIEFGQRPPAIGRDVSGDFFELQLFMAANYHFIDGKNGYTIFERNDTWAYNTPHTVLAYPLDEADVRSWFTDKTNLNLAALQESPSQDEVDEIIGGLATIPQVVSIAHLYKGETGPGPELERAASGLLFRISEYWSKQARVVDYVSVPGGCHSHEPVEATFGDQIQLLSADTEVVSIGSEQVVCVSLRWQADQPIAESYRVAAFIFGPEGTVIAQYDSIPVGFLAPTYTWKPGDVITDQFAIRLPSGLPEGPYPVVVTLYNEADLNRLLVSADGVESDQIIIGMLDLK